MRIKNLIVRMIEHIYVFTVHVMALGHLPINPVLENTFGTKRKHWSVECGICGKKYKETTE